MNLYDYMTYMYVPFWFTNQAQNAGGSWIKIPSQRIKEKRIKRLNGPSLLISNL